jgi:hypothetical protein
MDVPNAAPISMTSRKRWYQAPTKATKVFAATGQTAGLYGVPVAQIHPYQIGHDLAVCEVALVYRETRRDLAVHWRGETANARNRRGKKRPDAVLIVDGVERAAIEFASGYSTRRVASFIADCELRELPFEIWS